MSTIEEVALRAKVSVATVSRVVNQKSNVSDSTRERVLAAIKELKYQPNAMGVLLRKERTNTVLVLQHSIDNPFFSEIVRGIEKVAKESNYTVLISTTYGNPQIENQNLKLLQQHYVDGAILITNTLSKTEIDDLNDQFPIAQVLEYVGDSKVVHFTVDFYEISCKIMERLISIGKQNIYFVHAGLVNILSTQEKYRAYCDVLTKHKLPLLTKSLIECEFGYRSGFEIADKILNRSSVDAFFVTSDLTALGVLDAVKQKALKIPEEIAITGFDNTIFSQLSSPKLTSADLNSFKLGEEAMNYILRRLDKNSNITETSKFLQTKLINRETS